MNFVPILRVVPKQIQEMGEMGRVSSTKFGVYPSLLFMATVGKHTSRPFASFQHLMEEK